MQLKSWTKNLSELLSIVNSERKRGYSKRSNQHPGKSITSINLALKAKCERNRLEAVSNNFLQDELSSPEDFYLDLLRVFVKYGLMSELVLRDALIRKDHHDLCKTMKHKGKIRELLADKYAMSVKNIEVIIYQSCKKKRVEECFMQMMLAGNGNGEE